MDEKKTTETTNPTTATTPEEEKKEPAHIEIETIAFEKDAVTCFMNGRQLCEKINSMFRAVFADFSYCELRMNNGPVPDIVKNTIPANNMYVNLVFRENSADGQHMLKRRADHKGSRLLDKCEFAFGRLSNHAYTLDEDSAESLEEFLPQMFMKNNKKVDWNVRMFERYVPSPNGMYPNGFNGGSYIEVVLYGFPVELLLKKMYGDTGENGEKYDYGCFMMRYTADFASKMQYSAANGMQFNAVEAADGANMVLQITQLNAATVNKLYSIIGLDNRAMYGAYYGNPYIPWTQGQQ